MADHEWPILALILHLLVVWLIVRIAFPRWTVHTMNRLHLWIGSYNKVSHGRKHKNKRKKHVEQGSPGDDHRNSDKPGHIRNHSHQPARYKSSSSSYRSRVSATLERLPAPHKRDNRRGESRHPTLDPRKTFHESHHERHGGTRHRSGSRSRSKKHHFNHFLDL